MIVTDKETKYWLSNGKFKSKHIKNINNILRDVYSPIGHWKRNGNVWGVVDLKWDNEPWSILNRINTNFIALAVLINGINKVISKTHIDEFDFSYEFNSPQFNMEYDRFIKFLYVNKQKIFLKTDYNDGSNVLNDIIKTINKTKKVGDRAEELTKKYLQIINPLITNIRVPESSGESSDMLDGVDISFDYSNKKYTVQVKKVRYVIEKDNGYEIIGTSFDKHYRVNYLVTVTNNEIYFFRYDTNYITILPNGDLYIDESIFYKKFKL